MTIERMVCICFCVVTTPAIAAGQQRSDATSQGPQRSATTVIERAYPAGNAMPWRRLQTRSESGSREVVVDTLELPGIEGRFEPVRELVVETIRRAPSGTETRRDLFGFADHRRRLLETTESLRDSAANGDTSTVHNTWTPDLDGRLALTSRLIERTRTAAADVRQTDTTRLEPSFDGLLREAERTEYTERRINPGLVRSDSTHTVRDINGRWQPVETRRADAREIGASERLEEETIERLDINGKLAVSHRVHRTTTATGDGGRHTVEEVEGRNPAAPSDPMGLIRRTVTTVSRIGADRWVTERQVFERDVNGGLRLVTTDTEERAGSNF